MSDNVSVCFANLTFLLYGHRLSLKKTTWKILAEKNLKKIKELSEDPNVVLVFQDEVHFSVEATITRQWFPKGSCPKVRSYLGRKAVAYSGFVITKTGQLSIVKLDWFNFETAINSIRRFIETFTVEAGKKIHLIMDNAPWHKKAKRLVESEEEYADIRNSIIT